MTAPTLTRKQASRQTRSLSVDNFTMRSNQDGTKTFSGYASTFEQPYDMGFYAEVVRAGAFTKTLSENPDVRFLFNHDGLPMARTTAGTLTLSQDNTGLFVSATLNPERTDVNDMILAMQEGSLTQMSFGFRIIQQDWSPDWSQCDLVELALDDGDVSVVTYPANPNTSAMVRALRSAMPNITPEAVRGFYAELATIEERSGAVFSAANKAVLTALLSDLTEIGDAVNDATGNLDTLMSNNGADDDADEDTSDEETNSADTDNETRDDDADTEVADEEVPETRGTALSLALAQAEAVRLRA